MDTQKLNIACVFEGDIESGGGFQTQLSTILKLSKNDKYKITAFTFSNKNKELLIKHGLNVVCLKTSIFDKILKIFSLQIWFQILRFKWKTTFEKSLDNHSIDLVYFLSPSSLALYLVDHNYIYTVWDLCHRDMLEFPEVNYYREFELRENLYTSVSKKAVAILTDSKLGKDNLVKRYGVDSERIFNISFAPSINAKESNFINIKEKYNIESNYIYYPAQFWAHKNHVYIIDAIVKLKNKGILLAAVFSGSDKGNLEYILGYAKKLDVEHLIHYIGFAPNEEIYYLYKQSLALVMPSYFGPTNIPPLEAFVIGTPVIYSDLDGLREQVEGAALLCDLKNSSHLVEHLELLINSSEKRIELIELGYKRLEELQKYSIDQTLIKIFDDYSVKLRCWKSL
ncbi:glycosyltransferase family 4 protein [Acinetobacter wuhouensis]|uniref:Glycosyltransferase family 1 protein n=1 Tax=Acinetobacter wuhouensis TaxID=1879050 RepID=A0A4Q7AK18_9GAMM|nr:glycosyltransferase family 1 protein [Acinetobacter wuhouensis]RZG49141.1 glycosyltransferase family 1 protein [Acinetobacter wuhouensis]